MHAVALLATCVSLAACASAGKDISQNPGYFHCTGKSSVSFNGGIQAFNGLNGSVMADCGSGATLQWGPGPLPTAP